MGGVNKRHSIRLPGFDYRQAGAYFVTICVNGRICVLGEVVNGETRLSALGDIANAGWRWLPTVFNTVEVPVYCVMPNHVHAIITIQERPKGNAPQGRGGLQTAPTKKPLGRIIGAYKTHSTSLVNKMNNTPGARLWQRNYYERIIRNETEYEAVCDYIQANPMNWENDKEFQAK